MAVAGGSLMALRCLAVALVLAPAAAVAAETAAPRPASATAPTPGGAHDWSGFHLGAYGGTARGDIHITELFTTVFGGNFYAPSNNPYGFEAKGGSFGAQAGYDWQWRQLVFGVATDLGHMDLGDTVLDPNFLPVPRPEKLPFTSVDYGLNTALTARLGFALDRILVYARAGVALLEARGVTVDVCARSFCGPPTITATGEEFLFGLTVGGGLELALTDHWAIGAEYRRYDFEDLTVSGISFPNNLPYSQKISLNGVHTTQGFLNYRW